MLAADVNEPVLLASKGRSRDDDVRTIILLMSQRSDELQDAINLVCRHTHSAARDPKVPKSKRQWQDLLLGLYEPGQMLWAEILAGQHHLQHTYTRLHIEVMKDLVQQYDGPGKVVILSLIHI